MKTFFTLSLIHLFLVFSFTAPPIQCVRLSKRIEKKITKIAKKKNLPALEVSISTTNESVDFKYSNDEVEEQKIFGIGSATKFLTAVLIFELIEDGKLKLDDQVSNYMISPSEISGFENITIRNLLTHTSGLPDYTKNPDWITRVMNGEAPNLFEEKVLLIDKISNEFGKFNYSNSNYLFLEEIVETITNQPYNVYFNTFFEAHNLPGITLGTTEPNLQAFFAQTNEASSNVSMWNEYYGFDGGAYTNAKTLNDFLILLYRDKSLLTPNTLLQMEEWVEMEQMTIPVGNGQISHYGNGVMKLRYNDQDYLGHFGSTLKYQSMALYNPKTDTSISVVTNCSGRHYNKVFFQELIPAILDEL